MKYSFLLFIILCHQSFSQQQVSGVVINGDDGSKLAAASVFINNSSKGTTTDGDGRFLINGLTEKRFELVVSYAGFTTASVNITDGNINEYHTIKLYPRKQELAEISILMPEKDGWKKWGKLFTELFIGTSDFAAECTIENPEVLRFTNDKKAVQLHAYSNSPIIIHNHALGYNVKYQLEEFRYDFKKKMLTYMGYTGFDNMLTNNRNKIKRWETNRRQVYEGSLLHFMRAVYKDSADQDGFDVRDKIRVYSDDSVSAKIYRPDNSPDFVRVDSNLYRLRPAPVDPFKKLPPYVDLIDTTVFSFQKATTFDPFKKQKSFYFENYLEITYRNAFEKPDYLRQNFLSPSLHVLQNSDILLVTDSPVVIEENGLYFDPLNLLSSGYMGWHKMAETLPSDYIYIKATDK